MYRAQMRTFSTIWLRRSNIAKQTKINQNDNLFTFHKSTILKICQLYKQNWIAWIRATWPIPGRGDWCHLEALVPESCTTAFWISPGGSESVLSILQMVHLEPLGPESGTTHVWISPGGSESVLSIFQMVHLETLGPELSLIHIWRCRRSYACRSRWSPYH